MGLAFVIESRYAYLTHTTEFVIPLLSKPHSCPNACHEDRWESGSVDTVILNLDTRWTGFT